VFVVSVFAVVLVGIFVIGAVALVGGLVMAAVLGARDHRTKEERAADEYGDMPEGTSKVTPGFGANQIGGMGH
jgi:membrane associated rhomboid family serine protease